MSLCLHCAFFARRSDTRFLSSETRVNWMCRLIVNEHFLDGYIYTISFIILRSQPSGFCT